MAQTASMRELRNHTREVIERAQIESVTITDDGVPIAVLSALTKANGGWNVDAWLEHVTGPDWKPYDSGLAAEVAAAKADQETDAVERLSLL